MQVSELISKLLEFPPDAEVIVDYDDGYIIQPLELKYYKIYYSSYYDKEHEKNPHHNVVVHHC